MVVHTYINPYGTMLGGVQYNPLLVQTLTSGYNTGQSSLAVPTSGLAYPWQQTNLPQPALTTNQVTTPVTQMSPAVTQLSPQAILSQSQQLLSVKLSNVSTVCTTAVKGSTTTVTTCTSSGITENTEGEPQSDAKGSMTSMFPGSPCESTSTSLPEETNVQYLKELQTEKETMESSDCTLKGHAVKLLENEIMSIQSGGNKSSGYREPVKYFDIYRERPIRLTVRALVPVREHPKFNFVGKLLGPKGNSMKRLQEETMTKMAVLGRGSMRDKQKEEDLRLSRDPKYQHLHEDLHVEITAFAPPAEAHARIAYALTEVRKYLIPDSNDEIRQEQMREMEIISTNGDVIDNLKQTSVLLSGLRSQALPFNQGQQAGISPLLTTLGSTNGYTSPSLANLSTYMVGNSNITADASTDTSNLHPDQLSGKCLKATSSLDNSKQRTHPYSI